MIRRAWEWLRGKDSREKTSTADEAELLKQSEESLHQAELEAIEANELASSLHEMRVANRFKERMVLKIQGGIR